MHLAHLIPPVHGGKVLITPGQCHLFWVPAWELFGGWRLEPLLWLLLDFPLLDAGSSVSTNLPGFPGQQPELLQIVKPKGIDRFSLQQQASCGQSLALLSFKQISTAAGGCCAGGSHAAGLFASFLLCLGHGPRTVHPLLPPCWWQWFLVPGSYQVLVH